MRLYLSLLVITIVINFASSEILNSKKNLILEKSSNNNTQVTDDQEYSLEESDEKTLEEPLENSDVGPEEHEEEEGLVSRFGGRSRYRKRKCRRCRHFRNHRRGHSNTRVIHHHHHHHIVYVDLNSNTNTTPKTNEIPRTTEFVSEEFSTTPRYNRKYTNAPTDPTKR